MRFRIRTFRRRCFGRRRRKRGKGLPYTQNGKVYYGRGVVSKVLANLVQKFADSLIPI